MISGNRDAGVSVGNSASLRNYVEGNYIGTDVTGSAALPNGGHGVALVNATANTIGGAAAGAGNIIAFNGGDGVVVDRGTGNALRRNAIFGHDAGLGIRLLNGGNHHQEYPDLTSVVSEGGFTTVEGNLASAPNTTFTVELFVNSACNPSGYGEGEQFLASLTVATDGDGHASFTLTLPIAVEPGQFLTATATDPAGNTSEFSPCAKVTAPGSSGRPAGGRNRASLGTAAAADLAAAVFRTAGAGLVSLGTIAPDQDPPGPAEETSRRLFRDSEGTPVPGPRPAVVRALNREGSELFFRVFAEDFGGAGVEGLGRDTAFDLRVRSSQ